MLEPGHLGRVAVIGLGQIGGSIARRLTRDRHAQVIGYDGARSVLHRARRLNIANEYTSSLPSALRRADLTVLALPVASIIAALTDDRIPFAPSSLVIDVGSTKRLIMQAANRREPPLRFVGGHPLAGNEQSGLNGMNPRLFEGCVFALVPGQHARARDVRKVDRFVRALGARPLQIEADEHDRITALTIGLPHTIAFLVRDLFEREKDRTPLVGSLAGGSIRSTMRVSESDPRMVCDLIASNRDWIEYWWQRMASGPAPANKQRRR